MRKLLVAALLPLGLSSVAQTITGLTINPNPPTECQRFLLTINGTLPQNAELTLFNFLPGGPGEVNIRIDAEGSTSGPQPAFSYPYEDYGPLAQGTWTITVYYYMNNNLADSESITFTVGPQGPIDMGLPGERTLCNSEPSFPLFEVLEGSPTPGGEWLDPNGEEVPGGLFIPGTSIAGLYTYVIDLAGPCEPGYQTATITYTPNPSAGYGGTVQACSAASGSPIDLFAELNGSPEAGGTWSGPTPLVNGVYTPGVNTPGQYVYTVQGVAPCGNPTATINIQSVNPSNAGTGTDFSVCENDQSENLSQHVTGEQTSGSWYSEFGFPVAGYNQSVNLSVIGGGAYYYIVPNAVCGADTATVVVTLIPLPCNVGMDEVDNNVASLVVKPNPAEDRVLIEAELLTAENSVTFELIGVDGRIHGAAQRNTQGTSVRWAIDVEGLSAGAYTVRMRTATGIAFSRLIVR